MVFTPLFYPYVFKQLALIRFAIWGMKFNIVLLKAGIIRDIGKMEECVGLN
jgi:hypothetical protein